MPPLNRVLSQLYPLPILTTRLRKISFNSFLYILINCPSPLYTSGIYTKIIFVYIVFPSPATRRDVARRQKSVSAAPGVRAEGVGKYMGTLAVNEHSK
jgi:hypothetical protein